MRQLQALHQQRPDLRGNDDDEEEVPKTPDETAPARSHSDVGFPGSPYGGFGHDDRAWNPPVDHPAPARPREADRPTRGRDPDDDDIAPGTGDEGGTG